MTQLEHTRKGFSEALVEIGQENENVVVLDADVWSSNKLKPFIDKFPERYFQVGIAEQDMIGIAAGLSFCGKIPFTSSFSVFTPGNCFGQTRLSVGFTNANVKICGSHSGIDFGKDGGSAQSIADIAISRALPNFTVIVPCDYFETKKAVHWSARIKGPVYLRFGRSKWPVLTNFESRFEIGKANVLRPGCDVTVVGCGSMVANALKAAKILKNELDVQVINCHTIKPIDKTTLINAAKDTGRVVTAEDHSVIGGLGSAVSEVLAEHYPVPMRFVGVKDRFGQSGAPDELYKEYGLTPKHIVKAIRKLV